MFSFSIIIRKPGPKPIDGIWAKYWYASVWQSSQFTAKTSIKYTKPLTPAQLNLYRECLPFYQFLYKYAVGVDPLNPGSSVVKLYLPLTWKQNIGNTTVCAIHFACFDNIQTEYPVYACLQILALCVNIQ